MDNSFSKNIKKLSIPNFWTVVPQIGFIDYRRQKEYANICTQLYLGIIPLLQIIAHNTHIPAEQQTLKQFRRRGKPDHRSWIRQLVVWVAATIQREAGVFLIPSHCMNPNPFFCTRVSKFKSWIRVMEASRRQEIKLSAGVRQWLAWRLAVKQSEQTAFSCWAMFGYKKQSQSFQTSVSSVLL